MRILLLAVLALCAALGASDVRAAPPQSASIIVEMTGFRSNRGRAMVALWRGKTGFPGLPPSDTPMRSVTIERGRASARFEDVPAGVFAITVFHDEDGDTELEESFFGIPREGLGFSRDVRPRFSAPHFDDAKLTLAPATTKRVLIKMFYM